MSPAQDSSKTFPLVSVVLPTYNRAGLLSRAIRGVLRQTMPDFELIVIDDASTDDTERVVRAMEDPRIRYLKRTVNHLEHYKKTGEKDNPRNDGLKAAQGRYIAYIDSDDIWRTNLLDEMTRFLDRHPDVAMAYGDAVWHRNLDGTEETANCNLSIDFGPMIMRHRNVIRTLTVMHRREVVDTVGWFGPVWVRVPKPGVPYVGIEDWDYWFRISEHFKVKHHPVIVAHKINKTSTHYEDPDFDPEFALEDPAPKDGLNRYDLRFQIGRIREFLDLSRKVSGVRGWLKDLEGYSLYMLASLGAGLGEIVEIGSYMGLSTCWLALGSKSAGREKVFAVDHFMGSPEHQPGAAHECRVIAREGSTFRKFLKNLAEVGVDDWVIPVQAGSEEAEKGWDRPIRLLFIDGDHAYEATRKDFELWSPHLVRGGYLALHDVGQWEGVTRFHDELTKEDRGFQEVLTAESLRVFRKNS